jgi:hypothetical protein
MHRLFNQPVLFCHYQHLVPAANLAQNLVLKLFPVVPISLLFNGSLAAYQFE